MITGWQECEFSLFFVGLGGRMVIVLATENKVLRFEPGQGLRIFKGGKNT
jgi:hypothetical protein